MRGKENLRKLFSMVLALVMLVTLMPNTALATDDNIATITLSSNISSTSPSFTSEAYDLGGNLIDPVTTENGIITWKFDSTNLQGLSIALNNYDKTAYSFTGYKINGNTIVSPLNGYSVSNDPLNQLDIMWEGDAPSAVIPEPGWDIVAVFEEKPLDPADATYKVSADTEDISKGSVKCEYRGKKDSADKWKVSATASDNMQFDYWELTGTDNKVTANPLDIEITENRNYIAHFKPVEILLGDEAQINKLDSTYTQDKLCDGNPTISNDKFYGTSGTINIPFALPAALSNNAATIKVDLYGGSTTSAESLASQTFETNNLTADEHYFKMLAQSIPSALDNLTVAVQLTDTNGARQVVTKTYSLSDKVGKYTVNNSWTFIPSPDTEDTGAASVNESTLDPGPYINDAAAFANADNGAPELFLCGPTGIFTWNKDKTAVVRMDMTPLQLFTQYKGVLAIGGTDSKHLTALVHSNKQTDGTSGGGFYICTYDGTAWKLHENSQFGDIRKNGYVDYSSSVDSHNPKEALIFSENNIWIPKKHWDGTSWSNNDIEYNSFYQMSNTSGFAGSVTSGLSQYKDGAWSRILKDSFSTRADIIAGTPDGSLLVKTASAFTNNTYLVRPDVQTVTKVDIPSNIASGSIANVAIGYDGAVYLILNGTQYTSPSFTGSLVLKQENGEWVLQDISAFRAEGDKPYTISGKIRPDGVNIILNPMAGVSVAAGASGGGGAGSLYLLQQNVTSSTTITFDGNGGTVRGNTTITGKVNDPVDTDKVPSATKDGCYFSGWYYDKECTKEWKESSATMPASNLTLYAKLLTKGTTPDVDELSYHRDKAIETLKKQYAKYNQKNYSSSNWNLLKAAYNDGIQKIKAAKPADGDYPENNIIAELNAALKVMSDITPENVGSAKVAVSVDANTLGLGYIVKPTLVSCDEMAKASQVITDLLSLNGYKWKNTGNIDNGFYLSQVYDVDQSKATVAPFIINKTGESAINYDDRSDKMLGEFDYYSMSGWMYSMGDNANKEYPKFPGIGASDWHLTNGEVMRWQFTVFGYGSDLNADNSTWGKTSIAKSLGNKNELTWAVAELRDKYSDAVLEANSNYAAAMTVLTDPEANQSKIDKALKTLNSTKIDATVKTPETDSKNNTEDGISTVLSPKGSVNSKGEANVEMSAKDMTAAMEQAQKDEANTIVIAPSGVEKANKLTIQMDKTSLSDIANSDKLSLKVKSDLGNLTLSNSGLAELSKQSGSKISITVAKTAEDTIGISITMDNKAVDKISGGVKTAIPVKEGDVLVLVNADGTEKIIKKSVVANGIAYTILDGSATIKIKSNSKQFSDVKDSDWYQSAVGFASGHELFMGTSESAFSPNAPMNRGMLVTALHRLEDTAAAESNKVFDDVTADQYYTDAVSWAVSKGVVTGVSDTDFAPNEQITREQLATMLFRYAKAIGSGTSQKGDLSKFGDKGKVSTYASEAMQWAVGSGLISGRNSTTLDATGKASRAEVAAVLQRFVTNIVK